MKKSGKYILLGTVCLAAVLFQSVVRGAFSAIAVLVPYLAFCLCAFIVGGKSRSVRGAGTVLLFGLLLLPVFDYVYSALMSWLGMSFQSLLAESLAVHAGIVFVQALVYFAALLFVYGRMSKEKERFSPVGYIVPVLLSAGYSVLEGMQAMAMANALEQGELYGILSAASETAYLGIIAQILFYSAVFYVSAGFVKE